MYIGLHLKRNTSVRLVRAEYQAFVVEGCDEIDVLMLFALVNWDLTIAVQQQQPHVAILLNLMVI